jgi:FkbM family methyltransferase
MVPDMRQTEITVTTQTASSQSLVARLWRRGVRLFRTIPKPIRLPFGSLWLARNDGLSKALLEAGFEDAECRFVERFLQRGMIVLDVGAHHGLYALLASKRVGRKGRVIAFEPSSRERRALRLHALLNFRTNISVQGLAVGDADGQIDLYVMRARDSGCNSLRPPAADAGSAVRRQRVQTIRLDAWLKKAGVNKVDFIKLDVEGGELDALRGAEHLLDGNSRPLILAEVQDVRTRPWGYSAREIIDYLAARRYRWFRLVEHGLVRDLDLNQDGYEGNFVACPEESLASLPGRN